MRRIITGSIWIRFATGSGRDAAPQNNNRIGSIFHTHRADCMKSDNCNYDDLELFQWQQKADF